MESSPYANEGAKNKKWKVAKLLPQTSHHFSETEKQAISLAVLSPTFGLFFCFNILAASFCREFEKHDKQAFSL